MPTSAAPELTPQDLMTIQALVYRLAGIRIADAKRHLVEHRLARRLRERRMASYRDYCLLLSRGEEDAERQSFLNALTTNETYFFRHKQHWDFIAEHLVPLWKNANHRPRIWSTACSTGEEPYSAAILLHDLYASGNAHIDATDINDTVLRTAKEGTYGAYSMQKVTMRCRERYFQHRSEDRWLLLSVIRQMVTFRQGNLMQPTSGSNYDLVLCRNVLIYFDDASKDRSLRLLSQRMSSSSYLIIGGAESLGSLHAYFDFQAPGIYRKAKHA